MDLEGFDEFIDMCEGMNITDEEVSSALRKGLKYSKDEATRNAPNKTGKTRKSVKLKIKRLPFGVQGIVLVDDWRALFQEFRNTKQKGIYVGWFERSINKTEDQVIGVLKRELLDDKVK